MPDALVRIVLGSMVELRQVERTVWASMFELLPAAA